MNKKFKKLIIVLITLSILMLAFILSISGIFNKIETKFVDMRLSFGHDKNINPEIVRLYLDNSENFDADGSGKISRAELIKLIEYIELSSPKLLLLDLDFSNYSNDEPDAYTSGSSLSKVIDNYDNIIVGIRLNKTLKEDEEALFENSFLANSGLNVVQKDNLFDDKITYYPDNGIFDFGESVQNVAALNVVVSEQKVREMRPVYRITQEDKNYYIPSMSFAAFLKLKGLEKKEILLEKNHLFVGDVDLKLNNDANLYINLKEKGKYYASHPINSILQTIRQNKRYPYLRSTAELDADGFKNKILILEGNFDNLPIKTLSNNEKYTNGEVVALELDNYLNFADEQNLNSQFPTNSSLFVNVLLTALFCICIVSLNLRSRSKIGGVFLIIFYIIFVFVWYLFTKRMIDVALPLYFMLVTLILTVIYGDGEQKKIKNLLISTFRQHVSKEVLNLIVKNSDQISLKPEKKFVSMVYFNIVDFPALTSMAEPDELISRLNEIFDIIITFALKNNGTVNKINSNSVMVYWGAPISVNESPAEDAKIAIKTAIDIWKRVTSINARYVDNDFFPIELKIAIHSGEVITGNIGTNAFSSYSAFGGSMDDIYQISKISDRFDKDILVSQTAYELLKTLKVYRLSDKNIEFAYAGAIPVKTVPAGKLTLYELREETDSYTADDEE